jgi:hypothetical protein
MRVDMVLWLAAGLVVLLGGSICLASALPAARQREIPEDGPPSEQGELRQRAAAVSAYLGLGALLVGLAWRAWVDGNWPGATASQALLLVASAALLLGTWPWPAARGPYPGTAVSQPLAYGLGLLATGLLILAATVLAWIVPAPASPQANSWLFGLRSGLAGLGLGGWLFVFAGSLSVLWQERLTNRSSRPAWSRTPAVLAAGYPWLTAALLVAGAWQMTVHAVPWRGAPADLWLAVAWLFGAAYVALGRVRWTRDLGAWPPAVLSLAGLAAALLAAGQAGSLFW